MSRALRASLRMFKVAISSLVAAISALSVWFSALASSNICWRRFLPSVASRIVASSSFRSCTSIAASNSKQSRAQLSAEWEEFLANDGKQKTSQLRVVDWEEFLQLMMVSNRILTEWHGMVMLESRGQRGWKVLLRN